MHIESVLEGKNTPCAHFVEQALHFENSFKIDSWWLTFSTFNTFNSLSSFGLIEDKRGKCSGQTTVPEG